MIEYLWQGRTARVLINGELVGWVNHLSRGYTFHTPRDETYASIERATLEGMEHSLCVHFGIPSGCST